MGRANGNKRAGKTIEPPKRVQRKQVGVYYLDDNHIYDPHTCIMREYDMAWYMHVTTMPAEEMYSKDSKSALVELIVETNKPDWLHFVYKRGLRVGDIVQYGAERWMYVPISDVKQFTEAGFTHCDLPWENYAAVLLQGEKSA